METFDQPRQLVNNLHFGRDRQVAFTSLAKARIDAPIRGIIAGLARLRCCFNLHVVPFMDSIPRGVFATRAPKRPNPIGLSVVKLQKIQGNILYVENVDIVDGTPLLDIKPYVPEFDKQTEARAGWLEEARKDVSKRRSDQRFK